MFLSQEQNNKNRGFKRPDKWGFSALFFARSLMLGLCFFGAIDANAQNWSAGSSPVVTNGYSLTVSSVEPNIVQFTDNGTIACVDGGSVTITGAVTTAVGSGINASGVLTLSGGAITNKGSGAFVVGYLGGTGTVTIAHGATLAAPSSRFRLAGNEDVQRDLPSHGEAAISGTLSVNTLEFTSFFPTNQMPPYAESAKLTLNTDGIVEVGALQKNDCAASTFLFNGGTLRALQDTPSFITGVGVLSLVIADGKSAILDTNGKIVTISSLASPNDTALTLSGQTNATSVGNGGLVKTGAGSLIIRLPSACNTFTGSIEVVQGTLDLGRPLATNQTVIVHSPGNFVLYSLADTNKVTLLSDSGDKSVFIVGTDTDALNLLAINSAYYDDRLGSPLSGTVTLSGTLTHSAAVGMVGAPFRLIGQGGTLNLTNTTLASEAVQIEGPGTFTFMGNRTYADADAGKIVMTDGGYKQDQTFALADASTATPASLSFETGRFTAGYSLDVGVNGYGAFNANGATVISGRVRIGGGAGYSGAFSQTTGTVTLSSESYVGFDSGTGTLNVVGGQFIANADLRIASNPGDTNTRALRPNGSVTVSNALLRCNTLYFTSWWPMDGTGTNLQAGVLGLQSGGQAEVNFVTKNDDPTSTLLFDGGVLRARIAMAGLLTVSGANGTLRVIAASNQYATVDTGANAVTLQGGGGKLILTGAGGFKKLGSGTLTFSATQSAYTGDTVIAAGTLRLGNSNQIPDGAGRGNVQIATNAVLDLYGRSETINRLIGYGSVISTNALATLGILADGSSDTWTRNYFSGNIALDKQGTGTLTVAAANVFATNGTVSAGSLRLTASDGYPYYRFKIEGVKNYVTANAMQFSELALFNGDTDVTANRIGFAFDSSVIAFPLDETPDKVVDGIVYVGTTTKNKWLDFRASTNYTADVRNRVWIRLDFPSAQKVTRYNWATGNDSADRDPAAWRLQGSYNGAYWYDVDVRSNYVATSTRNAWVETNGFPVSSQNVPDAINNTAALTLKAGTALTLNGTSETLGGLAGLGTVTLNNANLTFATATNTTVFSGTISGSGSLFKTGAGTQCLWSTNSFTGNVEVDEGTLSVLGGGAPCTWFRFTIKKNRATINVTQFSELALYSADGTRWNVGLTQGTSTNALLQGQFATPVTYTTGSVAEGPDKLFDTSSATKWCLTANTPTPTNESSYRIVVMRLTNTLSEIVSYNLCTANDLPDRNPTDWTLEASTNGASWTEVDSRSGVVWPINPTDFFTWYNGNIPFLVTSRTVGAGNADVIPDSAIVEVHAGATLSIGNGTDVIGALRVDLAAGAGTITQLTAKENGTLYLVNATGRPSGWRIPLSLTAVTNPAALKSWTINVNGSVLKGYSIKYNAATGQFQLLANGTLIQVY